MFYIPKFTNIPNFIKPMLFVLGAIFLSTQRSVAQDFTASISILETITNELAGPVGKAIAAIAVAAIGLVFMMGQMDWKFAITVSISIFVIVGSADIVTNINTTAGVNQISEEDFERVIDHFNETIEDSESNVPIDGVNDVTVIEGLVGNN